MISKDEIIKEIDQLIEYFENILNLSLIRPGTNERAAYNNAFVMTKKLKERISDL